MLILYLFISRSKETDQVIIWANIKYISSPKIISNKAKYTKIDCM